MNTATILSVYRESEQEALRFKWIESEKAGRDLGDAAIGGSVRIHAGHVVSTGNRIVGASAGQARRDCRRKDDEKARQLPQEGGACRSKFGALDHVCALTWGSSVAIGKFADRLAAGWDRRGH